MTEITQADRDAAADFLESWELGPEMTVVKLAKAFARHLMEERAAIVAWLRGDRIVLSMDGSKEDVVASAIEAGEHLK